MSALLRTVHVLPAKFMSPPPTPKAPALEPDWLPRRRQLLTVMVAPGPSLSSAPPLPATPAPPPAKLPMKTQLVMVAVDGLERSSPALFSMAPPIPKFPAPLPSAWLLRNVLSVTVSEAPPKLSIAPPTLPPKKEPPPPPSAWLPLKVQETTVAVPSLRNPPPKTSTVLEAAVAVLLVRTSRLRVRWAPASLRMPPPPRPPTVAPLAMVRPARVTVAPLLMSKTRLEELPLTVRRLAPRPSMSRFLLMTS